MDYKVFYDELRKTLFKKGYSTKQVEGLDNLLKATDGLLVPQIAYILATAYHETGQTMQPVRETFAPSTESAIARLETAWNGGKLKWVKTPYWRKDADGKSWLGRGYVQLTHKFNYERATKELGVDFVKDPDLAMNPKHAADILVKGMMDGWFTKRSLPMFVSETKKDYVAARYVVNGTDRASSIASYAVSFEAAIVKAKGSPATDRVDVPSVVPDDANRTSIVQAIIELLTALFRSQR